MLGAPIRSVILDLDGVVYLEHTLIPGAAAAIAALRRRGIAVLFVTNNATHTRAQFAGRLTRMGVPCRAAELMNASFATARRLAADLPRGARVFVFGPGGLARELARVGLVPVTCRTAAAFERHRRADPRIRAIAVSFHRSLTWWGLCSAHLALQRGARLVACNRDVTYPGRGLLLPGTGSLVKLLEAASGRPSELIGKPSPELFNLLLAERGLMARDCLVVGDRLDIDAAAGRAAGARTALVLTGVDTRRDARRARAKPDLIARDLPALIRHPALAGTRP